MRSSPSGSSSTSSLIERDPVCVSIEALLHDLEVRGKTKLRRIDPGSPVRLTFGSFHAEGVTYDIALIRLATAMMDDSQYCHALMDVLREPMLASQ
jgi:hypothetical protein